MALTQVNSNNVFEGAIITDGTNKKYVYKVNKKSMYIGDMPYSELLEKWNKRAKGTTWKEFMKRVNGTMVSFEKWQISELDASRKEEFDKINKIKKNQKSILSKEAERQLEILYDRYLKSLEGKKGKTNYRFPNGIDGKRFIVIAFNNDRWSLLNIDYVFYFYDLDTKIYIQYDENINKNGKEIVWPTREEIINHAETVELSA